MSQKKKKASVPYVNPPKRDPEIEKRQIVFICDYLVKRGSFCWKKGEDKAQKSVKDKLKEYTELRLCDFRCYNGADLKIYEGPLPSPRIKGLAHELIEINRAWRFRINKKIRILSYLNENTFFVCWIDWQHKTGN